MNVIQWVLRKKCAPLFQKFKMVQKVILEVIRTTRRPNIVKSLFAPFSIFKIKVHIFFVAPSDLDKTKVTT